MQDSDSPAKVPLPFAVSAAGPYITTIPIVSQIGVTDGAASYADGFPPLTFVPISTGGAGPFGQDFNGILNQISAGVRWQQSGAPIGYDATHSANIGGYPNRAIIRSAASATKFWLSTVDNNLSNPDFGGANWTALTFPTFPLTPVSTLLGGNGTSFTSVVLPSSQLLGGSGSAFTSVSVGNGLLLEASVLSARPRTRILYARSTAGVANFTVPADTFWLYGHVVGAGGGGAGTGAIVSGGGGGAGGYAEVGFAVTPGDVITTTVGAGGAQGGPENDGGNGGSSSIGAFLSATGGTGGICVGNAAGGYCGLGSSVAGGFVDYGGQGGDGSELSIDGVGGNGGASYYGGGGRSTTGIIGDSNHAVGSGGGGGYNVGTSGGVGANGAVIIYG